MTLADAEAGQKQQRQDQMQLGPTGGAGHGEDDGDQESGQKECHA
jgi:hypothetical protein